MREAFTADAEAGSPLAIFSDFDGTIAHPDTLNLLAESFAGVEFRRRIGRCIASGELSLREAIQMEVQTIRGSLDEVLTFLRGHVQIDKTFPGFARWCQERQMHLTILSGGMRQVIESLLEPYDLGHVLILANRVRVEEGRWHLEFVDNTPWGHDKGAALRQARQEGYRTAFIGDGLSDRSAAGEADLVFAKSGLARYCDEQKIGYHTFDDFSDVQRVVENR
jgi:HAD superfamily phosphoserine phosphatase-like hydrolase